jgi:DNA-binding response OmpR family regulator
MSKTLLIVDDEIDLRELIADLLVEEGYNCLSAGSVQEASEVALEYLKTGGSINLVITDLNMPGGSGIDLLKNLREKGVDSPFLFLSGDVVDSELRPYMNMGVVGYQLKPFRSVEIIARLNSILGGD